MTNNISIDYDEYMYIEIFINTLQSSDISYQYNVCRHPIMTKRALQDVAFPLGMIVVSNWVLGTPAPPGPQVASKI